MATYRLIAADINGAERGVVPYSSLGFTDVYNDAGTVDFEVSKHAPELTPTLLVPCKTELHLYRITNEGATLVWGGYLWSRRGSFSESTRGYVGASYFSRLARREIKADQVFTGVEQLDIAWSLIDYTQSRTGGNLGITQASVPDSGVTRTISYLAQDRPKIADSIQTLAGGIDGFDFAIIPSRSGSTITRLWTAYYPQKGQVRSAVIQLGKNADDYTWEDDGAETTSERTGRGTGTDSSTLLALSSDAATLMEFGLLEDTTDYLDVDDLTLLQELTDEDEANFNNRIESFTAVVQPDEVDAGFELFDVGDSVRVRIVDGRDLDTDTLRRVSAKTIAIDSGGKETMTVTFDREAV